MKLLWVHGHKTELNWLCQTLNVSLYSAKSFCVLFFFCSYIKNADSLKVFARFPMVFGFHSQMKRPRPPQVLWGKAIRGTGRPWWIQGRRKPFVFTEIKSFEVASWPANLPGTSWFCSLRGRRKVTLVPKELIDSFWWDRTRVLEIIMKRCSSF